MKDLNSHRIKNAFTSLLSRLKVKYTTAYANRLFNEHPHKYDLYGISKMLSDYKIENAGIQVNDKKTDIYNLETPFIAHVGNAFVTVNRITNDKVFYRWDDKDIENSVPQFIEIWSGIALIAEVNEDSIEPGYHEHKKHELFSRIQKIFFAIAISVLLFTIGLTNYTSENVGFILLIIVNLIGAYIGCLLVLKQKNIQSNYADKMCSLFKQGDCNNVLETSAAKLVGLIGWSEIGFGYFISNILLLICMPSLLNCIAIVNLFTLPYTLWRIWYQKFKAKHWCPLYLIVQGVFWATFIINLAFGFIDFSSFNYSNIIITFSVYAIFILGLNIFIPILSEGQKVETITQEMNSTKMKDEVFLTYMKNQPYYEVNKSMSKILFGNSESPFIITILTNPHCSPCAKMHKRIDHILCKISDNVCVQYIFSSFNETLDYTGKFLTAVYLQKDKQ